MNLRLVRKQFTGDGVFSELTGEDGSPFAFTLEHAYGDEEEGWEPKIPSGTYECVRGQHQLLHGEAFETFEVTGVPGHSNILFHAGNFDQDSEGCILVGARIALISKHLMITESKATFRRFMDAQAGLESFTITIL